MLASGFPIHLSLREVRTAFSAVPGEVKYKISIFGPKTKMRCIEPAEMKLAKPVLSEVEAYSFGLPR